MSLPGIRRNRRQFAAASIGATLLGASGLRSGPVLARDENSYESPEFGMVVTWQAPWEKKSVSEKSNAGYESITLNLRGASDYITLSTSEIAAEYDSAEDFLDHYEESMDPDKIEPLRDSLDGVDFLIQERTETSVTTLLFFETSHGSKFEFYEFRAEPDAEFGTATRMISNGEIFEGNFKGVQQFVTLNDDPPFVTVDDDDVVDLIHDALSGKSSSRRNDDEDEDDEDRDEDDDDRDQDKDASNLDDVRNHLTELSTSVDDFIDIINTESISEQQADEANAILALWADAPDRAAEVEFTRKQSDIEDAYLEYTETIAETAVAFITWLGAESGTRASDRAANDFTDGLESLPELEATLDDLLTDAGA